MQPLKESPKSRKNSIKGKKRDRDTNSKFPKEVNIYKSDCSVAARPQSYDSFAVK